jgi:hypothetical protein
MRWTSKVVNLRVVVFYDGFNQSENNLSRVDNLMFTSYMNTLNYFIIPKLLKVVYYLNLLFCRRLQNNFWKKIYNYRTGLKKNIQLQNRTEKKPDFQHTSGCQGLQTERQPIVFYIMYVWVVQWVVYHVSKFSVKHPNCLITFT